MAFTEDKKIQILKLEKLMSISTCILPGSRSKDVIHK